MSAPQIIGFAVLAWLACGLGAAGLAVAYFQGRWPGLAEKDYRTDLAFGLVFGLIWGPVALIMAFCLSGFGQHGWRLRR